MGEWTRTAVDPGRTLERVIAGRFLILDYKVYVKTPKGAGDWDVAVATLYPSFGKALDYSKADEDKWKAIEAKQYKTDDEQKQREMTDVRFSYREYLGTSFLREINLRPMP